MAIQEHSRPLGHPVVDRRMQPTAFIIYYGEGDGNQEAGESQMNTDCPGAHGRLLLVRL